MTGVGQLGVHLSGLNAKLLDVVKRGATMRRIERPSDNPSAFCTASRLASDHLRTTAMQGSIQVIRDRLSAAYIPLKTVMEVLGSTMEVAMRNSSELASGTDAFVPQLDAYLETMVGALAARFDGFNLFGGRNLQGELLQVERNADNRILGVQFLGADGVNTVEIGCAGDFPDAVDPALVRPIAEGIAHVVNLRDALAGGHIQDIQACMPHLTALEGVVQYALSAVSTQLSTLDRYYQLNEQKNASYNEGIVRAVFTDIADVAGELRQTEHAMEAARSMWLLLKHIEDNNLLKNIF